MISTYNDFKFLKCFKMYVNCPLNNNKMVDFNWQEPFGNPLIDWAITGVLIVASVIGAKILYWVMSNILRKAFKKTKNQLDDLLLDRLESPMAYFLGTFGIWKSIDWLTLTEIAEGRVDKVFYLVTVIFVAWALSRVVEALIKTYLSPIVEKSDSDLDDQILPLLTKTLKIVIWSMAIVIGLNNAGYDVGAIVAGLGIGGLALALAAQDSVKNLFGGFTIFTDKPFKIKDRVKVAGFDGNIEEIGIRSTRLRTLEGRMVTIPNSKFADSAIENVTSEPNRKVVLNLGLTYDTDELGVQKAIDIARSIVEGHEETDPAVAVGFNAFNDSALNVIVVYRIVSGGDILGTQTTINLEILKQFNAAKLEFAFPTQTLHLNKMN